MLCIFLLLYRFWWWQQCRFGPWWHNVADTGQWSVNFNDSCALLEDTMVCLCRFSGRWSHGLNTRKPRGCYNYCCWSSSWHCVLEARLVDRREYVFGFYTCILFLYIAKDREASCRWGTPQNPRRVTHASSSSAKISGCSHCKWTVRIAICLHGTNSILACTFISMHAVDRHPAILIWCEEAGNRRKERPRSQNAAVATS